MCDCLFVAYATLIRFSFVLCAKFLDDTRSAMASASATTNPNTGQRILTKNSNRSLHVRKAPNRSVEQERDLRDQLYHDIEQKTKACSNYAYDCSLPRVDGHEFCLKHILLDPKAPYKQCSFTYPRTSKRCRQPAPKRDVYTNLCFEHSRQTQLHMTRSRFGTFRNVESNETLMCDLAHRLDAAGTTGRRTAATAVSHHHDAGGTIGSNNKYVDAFGPSARILNYASDDSDTADALEMAAGGTLHAVAAAAGADDSVGDGVGDIDVLDATELLQQGGTWTRQDVDQSDNESVDSQNEDFLKHAGIYTTEEATVITKSKMVQLQTLYSEQIFRLKHLLRQKRRNCLLNVRVERDSLRKFEWPFLLLFGYVCQRILFAFADHSNGLADNLSADLSALNGLNVAGGSHGTNTGGFAHGVAVGAGHIVQPRKTQKQKALNQYLKKHGVEAVLQHKATERRNAIAAAASKNQLGQLAHSTVPANRCTFSEGGVKCTESGLPLTKFCRKHILDDRAQVLFKACAVEKSGVVCQEPVPIAFENATCLLHFELPPQRVYTQKVC